MLFIIVGMIKIPIKYYWCKVPVNDAILIRHSISTDALLDAGAWCLGDRGTRDAGHPGTQEHWWGSDNVWCSLWKTAGPPTTG